jgi:hypothetical protein
LHDAHRWTELLKDGLSLRDVAKNEGKSQAYIRTRSQLAILSPMIQSAILNGTQPVDLNLQKIVQAQVPLDWDAQKALYCFAETN